jgi:hypothetical protein
MDEEAVRLLKKIAGSLSGLNSAAALIFVVLLYIAYRVS